MTDRLNKTSICSIVFLDIIDYSKKPVSEQIEDKTFFNALINDAIQNIPSNDRVILDTGDGAAITLMGAPEEALFIALSVRDGILERNKTHTPILVRIGINLGSIRVMKDLNDRPNIIGDGINVAQRIMSFAGENQILVSRSYYEVTSRLTREITNMFTYSGIKQDKHIREHEVYIIKSKAEDEAFLAEPVLAVDGGAGSFNRKLKKLYLPFAVIGIFVAVAAWYILIFRPIPSIDKPAADNPMAQAGTRKTPNLSPISNVKAATEEKTSASKAAERTKSKQRIVKKDQVVVHSNEKAVVLKASPATKSGADNPATVNSGCSQVQIAMNQCR